MSGAVGLAQPAAAQEDSLWCWTRGAYLYDSGTFGHKSVCNRQHAVVVTLKRDGVPLTSYTSTQTVMSAAGNHIGTLLKDFNVQCGRRYQVVVQVYPQPMAVAFGAVAASQYWTSGTPRILCQPVASSTSSSPGG